MKKRSKRRISPGLAKSVKMKKPHAKTVRNMVKKAGKVIKSSKPS